MTVSVEFGMSTIVDDSSSNHRRAIYSLSWHKSISIVSWRVIHLPFPEIAVVVAVWFGVGSVQVLAAAGLVVGSGE